MQAATDKKTEEAKKAKKAKKKKKAKKAKNKKIPAKDSKAARTTHTIDSFFTATGTGLLGPADQDPLSLSPSRVRVGVDSSNPFRGASGRMGDNSENVSDN